MGGMCVMIHKTWNVQTIKTFCSPNLEHIMLKCWPFKLPSKITVIKLTIYIPAQADTDMALET